MKKICLAVIMLVAVAGIGFCKDYDFRKAKWGMTPAQVKNNEILPIKKDKTPLMLTYETTIFGINADLSYFFDNGKLTNAVYITTDHYTDFGRHIQNFEDMLDALKKKLGEPQTYHPAGDEEIENKDLVASAEWLRHPTRIVLGLGGHGRNLECFLGYTSNPKKGVPGNWQTPLPSTKYDFRKTKWGMTPAQVKASEKEKPVVDDIDSIGYLDNIVGLETLIAYYFINDVLTETICYLQDKHINNAQYFDDYTTFQKILTKKYGQPQGDMADWQNDRHKDDLNMALSLGYVKFFTKWETKTSIIFLSLYPTDEKPLCTIRYSSKQHADITKQKHDQKAMDAL